MVDAVCRVVVEAAVVIIYLVCNPGVVHGDEGFDVLFWIVLGYAYDEAFIYFGYIPVGGDCVFDVCDVKVVVFYIELFDKIICDACDVVAMVNVGQFVNLGQTFFAKSVYNNSVPVLCRSGYVFYQGAKVEEVVVSFWFASCHFLLNFSDS